MINAKTKDVKVIRPTTGLYGDKKLRVAAYCRVSTSSDDQENSFIAQVKYYNDFLRLSDNMELVDIYADEGITGTSINKRDDFNRMIRDSSLGKIDRIFVKSVSRFARNSLECIENIRLLKSYGTTVLFENDAIDTNTMNSEMILYIKSAFAQSESLSGSKRVSTAIRMKMSTGEFYNYTAPFGYKAENKTLIPIPEEAEIVKRIFNEYISGKGIGKITSDLNQDDVPGKPWRETRVRYILSNEKYYGDSLYQKKYTPPVLPLQSVKNRGEVPMYYVENTHIPIIDKSTFETVKQMLDKNQLVFNKRQKSIHTSFSGKLFCGDCGCVYKKRSHSSEPTWVCSKDGIAGRRCTTHPITENTLMKAFVLMYNRLQQHKELIIRDTYRKLLKLRKNFFNNNSAIEDIDNELSELAEQNSMYVRFHSQKIIDEITFMEQTSEIKQRINELRSRRIKLMSENEEERCIELLRETEQLLDEFPQAILSFDFNIFDKLVERIAVSSNHLVFELRCGIKLREAI
jgi:site-specific DNA recombinase